MKRSLWIIILVVLGIIVASPPLLAQSAPTCDIAGAWVGGSPPIPGLYDNAQIVIITSPRLTLQARDSPVCCSR